MTTLSTVNQPKRSLVKEVGKNSDIINRGGVKCENAIFVI